MYTGGTSSSSPSPSSSPNNSDYCQTPSPDFTFQQKRIKRDPEAVVLVERLLYEEQVACIDIRDTGNAIAKLAKEGLTKGYAPDFVETLNTKMVHLQEMISAVEKINHKKRELGDVVDDCLEKPQGGFVLRPRRFKKKKLMWDSLKENKKGSGDEAVRRVCSFCGTTRSAEWRRGPAGTKSLCNACGLHYSKILKRENMNAAQAASPKSMSVTSLLN
jgi:hypothetical protein